MGGCCWLKVCASNVLAKTEDAPSKSRLPPTSISSFAAHVFGCFNHPSLSPPNLLLASTSITATLRHQFPREYSRRISLSSKMPPKTAEKKPSTGGKAPAGKAPAEKKEAGKKTAAPSGDKKKRNKTRKETYSSYIYKGRSRVPASHPITFAPPH